MEDKWGGGPSDEIDTLIGREKEAADRNFDDRQFEGRLLERVRRAGKREAQASPFVLPKFVPVTALAVVLLAISGFLIYRAWPRLQPHPADQAIGTVLARSGYGRLEAQVYGSNWGIERPEYTEFGWALKGVLYASKRQALGDVDLTGALSGALREGPGPGSSGENPDRPVYQRPGSLRLGSGEDFRMFFSGFLKRLEEV